MKSEPGVLQHEVMHAHLKKSGNLGTENTPSFLPSSGPLLPFQGFPVPE